MRKRVLFVFTADEGSVFNACNVVFRGSVIVAIGKKFLVELDDFAGCASFFSQSVTLRVAAVDPNHFVGLCKRLTICHELKHFLVVRHFFISLNDNFFLSVY
jgi:hypothetical protein